MSGDSSITDLAAAVAGAAEFRDVIELHGGICGGLCAAGIEGAQICADAWIEDLPTSAIEQRDARAALDTLVSDTWSSLTGTQLAFEPLLPDEDTPLDARVDGLAIWCHGFLTGIALGGVTRDWLDEMRVNETEDAEIVEVIDDFAEISHATAEAYSSDDEARGGFELATLIEHVRVGTLLAFEALNEYRAAHTARSLH